MIKIDGSMGEGGGSVLRFSLALAAVRGEPIRIRNIRANRSRPGLSRQHLSAAKALRDLTNGKLEGAELRSEEVFFNPGEPESKKIDVDIGTAGSTTLILQAVMIPAPLAEGPVEVEITGGTDNPFAPPIDYLKNVTLPILRKIGYRGEVDCIRRGHYPKGGGLIRADIRPLDGFESIELTDRGEVRSISGRSHCVKLPGHIAERQAKSAEKKLSEEGYEAEIEVESSEKSEDSHLSPGTGIAIWAETENGSVLGSSSLGEKGKPAEEVGSEAASELTEYLETGQALDPYMADQLIPYLALASGDSTITSSKLTSHAITNVRLVEEILGVEAEVLGEEGALEEIRIKGSGL